MALQKLKNYNVKFTDLKKACTTLNSAGITEKVSIKVGIDGSKMLLSFLDAIETVPKTKLEEIPKEVKEFYNKLPDTLFTDIESANDEAVAAATTEEGTTESTDEGATEEAVEAVADEITSECPTFKTGHNPEEEDCQACETDYPDEQAACKKAVEALAKAAKQKQSKAKKAGKNAGKRSRYGHVPGSMSARIDDLACEGTTENDMVAKLMSEFDRAEKQATGKVKVHLNHLTKDLGIELKRTKEGLVTAKRKYIDGRNKDNIVTTI